STARSIVAAWPWSISATSAWNGRSCQVACVGPVHAPRIGPVRGHGRSRRRGSIDGHGGPGHAAAASVCHAAAWPASAPTALGECLVVGTEKKDRPKNGDEISKT
ncbi:MAG: hypothetical protein ACP5XB_02395, partial [Isosphaeraceae bacterium]